MGLDAVRKQLKAMYRSWRGGKQSTLGRFERIERTADGVTAAGGRGLLAMVPGGGLGLLVIVGLLWWVM